MRSADPSDVLRRLRALEDREQAQFDLRFFRTGPGEYGEGDLFLGIRVPQVRKLAREFASLPLKGIEQLLASKWHEARLLALVIMVNQYKRAGKSARESIFRAYLRNTHRINNWDLVDVSARDIVGEHLVKSNRSLLTRLARSKPNVSLLPFSKRWPKLIRATCKLASIKLKLPKKSNKLWLRSATRRAKKAVSNQVVNKTPASN